jgi:sialate O-acetylesterase
MATIIDIGEAKDIHPKNKQDVGKRLALIALADTYREKIVSTGPVYASMKKIGANIELSFKNSGSKPVATDGQPLKGFAIAGADQIFHWADARIEGNKVILSSKEVTDPVAARYAWADNPACNFGNAAGLPASPFRTDDWKMITRK